MNIKGSKAVDVVSRLCTISRSVGDVLISRAITVKRATHNTTPLHRLNNDAAQIVKYTKLLLAAGQQLEGTKSVELASGPASTVVQKTHKDPPLSVSRVSHTALRRPQTDSLKIVESVSDSRQVETLDVQNATAHSSNTQVVNKSLIAQRKHKVDSRTTCLVEFLHARREATPKLPWSDAYLPFLASPVTVNPSGYRTVISRRVDQRMLMPLGTHYRFFVRMF